ncbi:XRE family transcriptional regulator [Cupriavidus sp. D39]|uniref:XRE family transcriptional regulator n=1 Tax=Cupriavidus sp. D39 TaxID=2997877 RepID=UPI003B63650F
MIFLYKDKEMRTADQLESRAGIGFAAIPNDAGAAQAVFLPTSLIAQCVTFRDACALAWEYRANEALTKQVLAVVADLYPSHSSDYFHREKHNANGKPRRDLPAEKIADVERALGNRAISQYLARRGMLTLMEEVISARAHG